MSQVEIREIKENRGVICNDLLRSLPLWFGIEAAIQQYVSDVEAMPTFVAYAENRPVGFISLNRHNEWTAEVHIIAVRAEFHRSGIGRRLIEVSQDYLKALKYEFLSVKTLSPSRPNKEYEMTRKFYYSMGFRPVEEFRTLWGEANPCLLMIKAL
jgi:ribosomal protein S18 acetylase RimI-like enzyme